MFVSSKCGIIILCVPLCHSYWMKTCDLLRLATMVQRGKPQGTTNISHLEIAKKKDKKGPLALCLAKVSCNKLADWCDFDPT